MNSLFTVVAEIYNVFTIQYIPKKVSIIQHLHVCKHYTVGGGGRMKCIVDMYGMKYCEFTSHNI